MEKKNHLFEQSINEKIERQRGKRNEKKEEPGISWKGILMGVVTVLFAASILLRIFM